jgi:hypothetical protein
MKLHEIPEGSKIKVECFNEQNEKIGDVITFHHIDGMYSFCTVDGTPDNNIVHLYFATPLKKVGDFYELETTDEETKPQNKKSRFKKIPVANGSQPAQ